MSMDAITVVTGSEHGAWMDDRRDAVIQDCVFYNCYDQPPQTPWNGNPFLLPRRRWWQFWRET